MTRTKDARSTTDRSLAAQEVGLVVRAALVIVGALLLVAGLEGLGLVASIDDGLRSGWVRLARDTGTQRPSHYGVILVAADKDTIEHPDWGPPPWSHDQFERLIEQIGEGGPLLVVEAGHRPMFESSEALDDAIDNADVEVLIPRSGDPRRSLWTEHGLEHGDLVLGPDSRIHRVARTAGLPPVGDRLPVNYLLPTARLPVVPAMNVGDKTIGQSIPADSFSGKIVLLGVTEGHHEMLVDTPLGRMSPVEIEAHALTALSDGAIWAELPVPVGYLVCGLFSVFLLWSFTRLTAGQATLLLVTGSLLILVVDFATYQRALIRLGSARMLLCVAAVGFTYWIHETFEVVKGLRSLQARVLRDVAGDNYAEDEQGFWDELAQLGAVYGRRTLGDDSAAVTIIERNGDSWELELRAFEGLDEAAEAALRDRKLNLLRAPFRTPSLTLRAGWAAGLVPPGNSGTRKSLMIPIENEGNLLGLWLIHVDEGMNVEREQIERFEDLGRQMAATLAHQRQRKSLRDSGRVRRLRDYVDDIRGGVRALQHEQRWATDLLEQLPVRALIATVWGEIEFIDPQLEELLESRYPGLFAQDRPEETLRTILARLTGDLDQADRLLRNLFVGNKLEIEVNVKPGLEDPGDDKWVLSRINSKRGINLPGFRPAVHEHILLVATSSAPAKTVKTASGGLLRVLRGGAGDS